MDNITREQLEFIYRGGKTQRYHTEEVLHRQNVAEHSHGVAMLLTLIEPNARKELILAGLVHDLAEHVVGDVPAPSKRAHPEIRRTINNLENELLDQHALGYAGALCMTERDLLKMADIMDGMMFCVDERRRGNIGVGHVYNNFDSYIASYESLPPSVTQILTIIRKMWEELNASQR